MNKVDSGKKIVYVDPYDYIHRLCDKEIRDAIGKVNIYHFYSTASALDYLMIKKVHLVVSAILFPDINGNRKYDGIILFNDCKMFFPELPFIIHTAIDYKFTITRPTAYVQKSADLRLFLDIIRVLL